MGRIPLGRLPELIRQAYHFFFGYYFTDELYTIKKIYSQFICGSIKIPVTSAILTSGAIITSQEYAEMTIYPAKGSVKKIGEFTVVKLSD